jgi:hypothetical protein
MIDILYECCMSLLIFCQQLLRQQLAGLQRDGAASSSGGARWGVEQFLGKLQQLAVQGFFINID